MPNGDGGDLADTLRPITSDPDQWREMGGSRGDSGETGDRTKDFMRRLAAGARGYQRGSSGGGRYAKYRRKHPTRYAPALDFGDTREL